MWGRHVEYELHQATKKAKTEAQATTKATMTMRRLMTDPVTDEEEEEVKEAPRPSAGKFRDPAARMKG